MRDTETAQDAPSGLVSLPFGPPMRLQRSRRPGASLAHDSLAANGRDAVIVTRPGVFSNPFIHDDPAEAVAAYRKLIAPGGGYRDFKMSPDGLRFAPSANPRTIHYSYPDWLRRYGLPALAGRNLFCWCSVGDPCHGDVLLALANPIRCDSPETAR